MNYKCPFTGTFCDPACRFYAAEPQMQSQDPHGPGSCVLAQGMRVLIRLGAKYGGYNEPD